MISFSDWHLEADQEVLAMQYDNNTRVLAVSGNLPEGWTWEMLVSAGGVLDIIPLNPSEGGASAVLTTQDLARAGCYAMQLRGRFGEQVRHTNIIYPLVNGSLASPDQEVSP